MMPFATAPDGARLHYEVAGSGAPLVLLHGGLWDRRLWDDQWEASTKSFLTVRMDFRGYGRSDPVEQRHVITDDVALVLDAAGTGAAAVVGLSMGGIVALDLALANPDRLTALVLVGANITGFEDWTEEHHAVHREVVAAMKRGDIGAALDLELDRWCPLSNGNDQHHRRIAHENEGALLIDDDLVEVHEERALERLGEIRAPTLVVVGDRDVPEMLRLADVLATGIPGARKVVLEEADHVPNVRKPEEFNDLVIGFLHEVAA